MDQNLRRVGAGVTRRFQHGSVDPHHGVENRHDHEECVKMHKGQDDREVGIEQPFQRLINQSQMCQRLIDEAVPAKDRDPGDHPDDVRSPKRNRANQKKNDLPSQGAHMEGQEIGDGEPDGQGENPTEGGEFEGVEINRIGDGGFEQLDVVGENEVRNQAKFRVIPEADNENDNDRPDQKHGQCGHQRQKLQLRFQNSNRLRLQKGDPGECVPRGRFLGVE